MTDPTPETAAKQSLTLKWGTIKGWGGAVPGTKFREAIEAYHKEPVSFSVMQQHDTDSQKQAVCAAIDACEGEIWNDWDGKVMTKDQAKEYVTNYGKRDAK